jgi:endonuclease/exonuclease/phosphatase family metal-dependent hydrolase
MLAAVLEGDRGPFTVAAVHLSFVPGWNAGQLVATRRWLADLPGPYVLLGDFNMIGAVPRLVLNGAAVAGLPGPPGRHRWRDLARVRTYPAHRPVVQFDHVLAAGTAEYGLRGAWTPLLPVSDHRPLVTELTL